MAAKNILLLLTGMLAGLSHAADIKNSTAGGFSSSCWDVSLGPSHDSRETFSGKLRAECKRPHNSKSKYGTCSQLWLGNCYANIDGKIVPEPMYCKVGGYFGKEKKYEETTVNLDDLIHNDGGYLGCYDKRGDERGCTTPRRGKVDTEEVGKHSSSKSDHHTHTTTTTTTKKPDHTTTKKPDHTTTTQPDHTTTKKPDHTGKPDHGGRKSTSFITSTVVKTYTTTAKSASTPYKHGY
ncbi:hypothetical protein DL768_007299 [Monosporascus sp. mg162]|nr:hypothetical protein DL768_007299 [Monosporascus sp. mg162]